MSLFAPDVRHFCPKPHVFAVTPVPHMQLKPYFAIALEPHAGQVALPSLQVWPIEAGLLPHVHALVTSAPSLQASTFGFSGATHVLEAAVHLPLSAIQKVLPHSQPYVLPVSPPSVVLHGFLGDSHLASVSVALLAVHF